MIFTLWLSFGERGLGYSLHKKEHWTRCLLFCLNSTMVQGMAMLVGAFFGHFTNFVRSEVSQLLNVLPSNFVHTCSPEDESYWFNNLLTLPPAPPTYQHLWFWMNGLKSIVSTPMEIGINIQALVRMNCVNFIPWPIQHHHQVNILVCPILWLISKYLQKYRYSYELQLYFVFKHDTWQQLHKLLEWL